MIATTPVSRSRPCSTFPRVRTSTARNCASPPTARTASTMWPGSTGSRRPSPASRSPSTARSPPTGCSDRRLSIPAICSTATRRTEIHDSTRTAGRRFGEAIWHATDKLAVTLGLRYTVENKQGRFDSTVYGGLATTDPALIKAKLSILRPQSYAATVNDGAGSGRFTLSYTLNEQVMAYASYCQGQQVRRHQHVRSAAQCLQPAGADHSGDQAGEKHHGGTRREDDALRSAACC